MTVKILFCMCYLDVDLRFIDFVEDKDLLKWVRIKLQDTKDLPRLMHWFT